MKTCVFITGTNGVGKTTFAEALIEHYGGRTNISKTLTEVGDPRICFAGPYHPGHKYGGVDAFNCTRVLPEIVEAGLMSHDVIICEGMYLHTFGLNLTNSMFKAQRQLLVYLYAPTAVIKERLIRRSGAAGSDRRGTAFDKVFQKQRNCANAARKWASIGVPVLAYDTSAVELPVILEQVTKKISELCGK